MRTGTKLIIAVMLLLCACGGSGGSADSAPRDASCSGTSCDPDNQLPAPPLSCGGDASCPQGYRCVDDATDRAGVCVLGEELPGCGMTQEPCPAASVCVDDPNDDCDGGSALDCPGVCQPQATGTCAADADCPALPAVCDTCADGSFSCPGSRCDDGQCVVESKPCAQPPACAGIAGLPCPAGLHCVDDPADDCAPERGDVDCGGICVPGQEPLRCGGITGATCPARFTCIDDPSDTCDENGGADCPGLCEPVIPGECASNADCPQLRAPCSICPDGSETCPKSWCESGRCNVSFPSCAPAVVCGKDGAGCGPDAVCVSDPDNVCDPAIGENGCKGICRPIDQPRPCGTDGGTLCPPGYQCVSPSDATCDPNAAGAGCGGVCVPDAPPQCHEDSECVQVLAPCAPCADGTFSCPRSECRDGVCALALDACTGPGFCGGVAGFPCPPGQTCIDAPNDECDPTRGGADCAGMCVREEKPPSCGGVAGEQCPPGYECADDPRDDCDPTRGADCPGICRPAANPGCNSDADCFIGAPCRICPDGTATCPKASCINGGCQVEFGACADAPS